LLWVPNGRKKVRAPSASAKEKGDRSHREKRATGSEEGPAGKTSMKNLKRPGVEKKN